MEEQLNRVIDDLNENQTDLFPRYILQKEILHEKRKLQVEPFQSKWYQQLLQEQMENGSWGRFHTQDTKAERRVFRTTEAALYRAKDLSLDASDDMIIKSIGLMERYLNDEERWTDTQEHHYGWNVAFKTIIAANLSRFLPEHPLVLERKRACVHILQESIQAGTVDEDLWSKACINYDEILMNPQAEHVLWLLQKNPFLESNLEKVYFEYIWNRKNGIYYLTNGPSSEKQYLESRKFTIWLRGLENLSTFHVFPEYMSKEVNHHLLHEITRLINEKVSLPKAELILGHYSESWRKQENRRNDLILSILRVLVKANPMFLS